MQELRELSFDCDEAQSWGMAGQELHEDIHVAIGSEVVPQHRPKERKARNVMPSAERRHRLRIEGVKHASGQNYIVGAGDRVFDFEASAGKVVEFRPSGDGGVVYHTNHPIANDDLKPWYRAMIQTLSPAQWASSNSPTRFASIEKRLQRSAAAIDEAAIKAALRSKDSERHPICRSLGAGEGRYTFGATIMTLSGEPSLQVTMGPPDVNRFVRLAFSGVTGGKGLASPAR